MGDKKLIRKLLTEGLTEHDNKKIVAGVLIKCVKTNNVLLLKRNDKTPTWALVSGGVDKGESPLTALKREIYEEMFVNPNKINYKFIRVEHIPEKNMNFHYYEGFTESQFKPILDHENLDYLWCDVNHLPSPLYTGLLQKIKSI